MTMDMVADTTTNTLDIEEIMRDIRKDIAEKGYKNDAIDFDDIPFQSDISEFEMNNLEITIAQLGATWNVAIYHTADSNWWRILNLPISLAKKIIRKCLNFHVTPIVWEQNAINRLVLDALIHIRDYIKNGVTILARLDIIEDQVGRETKKVKRMIEQYSLDILKQNRKLKEEIDLLKKNNTELLQRLIHLETSMFAKDEVK
jgi:hypothetical protein